MTEFDADRERARGSRPITVSAAAAAAGTVLCKGPCRLMGWSLVAATALASVEGEGTAVAPAAGATIASIVLPQGTFLVAWAVELIGPAAAADQNNFQLTNGATQVAVSLNSPAAGIYSQVSEVVVVPAGGATVAVKAIGAGTAGVTYGATLVAAPADAATGVINDGGQLLANVAIGNGLTGTTMLGSDGIEVLTDIQLISSVGTLSGVIYVKDLVGDTPRL